MKSLTRLSAALLMLVGLAAGLRADESTLETYLDRSLRFIPNDISLTLSQEIRYNDNIDEALLARVEQMGIHVSAARATAHTGRDASHGTVIAGVVAEVPGAVFGI